MMKKISVRIPVAALILSCKPGFCIHPFHPERIHDRGEPRSRDDPDRHSFYLGEDYKSYYPEIRYGLGAMTEVGVKFGATSADFQ